MTPGIRISTIAALAAVLTLSAGCDLFVDDATRIERASASIAERDYRTAEIELKNVLRANTENLSARGLLGQVLLAKGDVDGAIKELRRARELGAPADAYKLPLARALMRKEEFSQVITLGADELSDEAARAAMLALIGRAEQQRGNLGPARQSLEAALAIDPTQPDALLGLARIARERGEPDEARRRIDELLAAHPKHHEALAALAAMQQASGQYSEAEGSFERAIAAADEPGEIYKRLEYRVGLIDAQLAQGDYERAQRSGVEAMRESNDHPAALMQAARADLAVGDFDAAIDKAQRVVSIAPEFAQPRLLLAAAAIGQGNNSLAANQLEGVLQTDPEHAAARKMLAQARMNLGSPEQALEALQPLLDSGSNDAQLLAMAGTANLRSGREEAGMELIQRGMDVPSVDPAIKLQAAANYLAAGEINQAIEVLESMPESEQISNRDLLLILALLRKGDEQAARQQAQSILDSRPGDAAAHRLMGGFHMAVSEFDAARQQFGQALAIDPNDMASIVHLARIDVELKEPEQAEQRFHAVLERQPGNLIALSALAQLRERLGDRDGAVALLEKAREANPNELGPVLLLTRYYVQTNKLALAAERAAQAVRAAPASSDAHMLLGVAMLAQGRDAESLGSLERAVELAPNAAVAHFHLGRNQEQMGTLDAAQKSFQRALELAPDLFPARAALAGVAYKRGDFKRALEIADQLAERQPDSVQPLILRGDIELARGASEAALVAYEQASARAPTRQLAYKRAHALRQLGREGFWTVLADWVNDHPDDAAGRVMLGDALVVAGDHDRAIEEYERAYAAEPTAAVATALARLHGRARHLDEAAEWLKKALEIEPGAYLARAAQAALEVERGNLGQALDLARGVRTDFPDRADGYRIEGDALTARKQYRAAIEAYQRAVAIERTSLLVLRLYNARSKAGEKDAVRVLESWAKDNPGDAAVAMQLAQAYGTEGKTDSSIEAYRRVLESQPDNIIALNNLAWIYFERGAQGDLQRGVDLARRAYELRRDVGAVADTYGWLLVQSGRTDEAMTPLRDAVTASPDDSEINYHYAVALHRNGNVDQARALLDKVLASGDDFASRDDAKKLRRDL